MNVTIVINKTPTAQYSSPLVILCIQICIFLYIVFFSYYRVCRKWAVLTRSPVLWKKIDVEILPSHVSQTTVMKCFVDKLPLCVTCIRLLFRFRHSWSGPLDFKQLSMRLHDRCPHLEMLILDTAILSDNLTSIIDLCTEFL